MSSPAGRRTTRSSQAGTPNARNTRNSQARSSPAAAATAAATGTPRNQRAPSSQLQSSPMLYESSPAADVNMGGASSPLRQMSDTQSTQDALHSADHPMRGLAPSSPLAHETQSVSAGDRTPRANRGLLGESSPIHYDPSSSPGHHLGFQSDLRSESSALFVDQRSGSIGPGRSRRGDINSDALRTPRAPPRRIMLDDGGHVLSEGMAPRSDTGSFANNNPDTSEAQALGGLSQSLIWGTTVSIDDTFASFKDFLRNFTKKYRMWLDGMTEAETEGLPDAESKPYWETMQNMLLLGSSRLYVDVRDLKAYPRTNKLWYQAQAYPQEIVPIMDQSVHDLMSELAHTEANRQKAAAAALSQSSAGNNSGRALSVSQSSDLNFPSSERSEEPPATPRASQQQALAATQAAQTLEDDVSKTVYIVRPFGLDKSTNLRELNPSDMDRLISIKGLVIRTTPVIPDMKDAFFKCQACNHSVTVSLDRGKIREPTECPRPTCQTKNSMQIVHNRCIFEDKQVIKLQETPDAVPAGQTPHSVSVCVYNELVDFCKAGDRVLITGIFRVSPVRVNPRQRTINSVHKTYVDVLHIQKVDAKRLGIDPSTLELDDDDVEAAILAEQNETSGGGTGGNHMEETRTFTPEEEAKIKETGARADVYDLLSRSLAPSIYEMDDVKKGILLQLFGGTNKSFKKGGSPRYRGDINVLLCGDPSTAKSQMLGYIHKIAPRGVYTSGKGSSAVGLTAYVARDPETRQLVLESGALVLSDGGVCCIDEFDKMSESTRSVLHEVMEQQTVSVAKAGIITTLNARTSILASANPIGSRYNPELPVPQNIDLPPTLLSRFDLVYLILDRADEKTDRRMAKHLLSMYLEDTPQSARSANEILPVEFLTSYISYARANIHPVLSTEAGQALVEAYVEMRKLGQDVRAAEKRITATTRQLESMIRLAEAHAKMRLSSEVTGDDVREAYRLIQSALKTAATDAQGRIDMSLLTEGTSAAERKRKADLRAAILRMLDEALTGGQTSMRYSEVARRMAEAASVPIESADLAECLRGLEMDGSVTVTGEGARRTVRRSTGVA
ncbi:minichromosome maintenance protein 4 (cell division control protein 54) [Sporothrix brasiliensis 5110]|uniref:DNA replication licensing factor MCM4 n=1 Tax=Sporothrix brasiliensis 5110 TaxID=1398154 RepID=A0A0C2IGM6_9PEZI|nr:minichromosome maintenance protein 4 (cell division control protein 54) [Sporothrix brasiliensis 5110]KIH88361.1 minichromosome maintenance protein 4 (cell division control protein 54) [Sporothrix brasiliensis 5110]